MPVQNFFITSGSHTCCCRIDLHVSARSSTYVYDDECLLSASPINGSLVVQLALQPGQIGIVVWEAE